MRQLIPILLLTLACRPFTVELDPDWELDNELTEFATSPTEEIIPTPDESPIPGCEMAVCEPFPICDIQGLEGCPPFECCPCGDESASYCDAYHQDIIWECSGGYFEIGFCETTDRCFESSIVGEAACVDPMTTDDPNGSDNGLDPGLECPPCNDPGTSFCSHGFGFEPDQVMHCNFDNCLERWDCSEADVCVEGVYHERAQCAEEVDCEYLGCTGVRLCGDDETIDCGLCGCCPPEESEICDNNGPVAMRLVPGQGNTCFEVVVCPGNSVCEYTDDGGTDCRLPGGS